MKRSLLLGLAALLALATLGCATDRIAGHSRSFRAQRPTTYALAVTVQGGLQPTPAQWAAIQRKVSEELMLVGAVLVTDIALADKIIRLDFRPNPFDPENGGQITLLGVRTNPYSGLARASTPGAFYPAFSFSNALYQSSWWGSSNYYSGDYFNYVGPWENGYTSCATPVATAPKPRHTPPHRNRPHDREPCPPDALHPRNPPTYASTEPRSSSPAADTVIAKTPSPEPASSSSARARWTGERSAWRTASDSHRPERAETFAESGYSGRRTYARTDGDSSRSDHMVRSEPGASRERIRSNSDGSRSSDGSWRSSRESSSGSGRTYTRSDSGRTYSRSDSGSSRSDSSYSSPSPSYSSSSDSYSGSSSSSGSYSSSSSSSSMHVSSATEPTATDHLR